MIRIFRIIGRFKKKVAIYPVLLSVFGTIISNCEKKRKNIDTFVRFSVIVCDLCNQVWRPF